MGHLLNGDDRTFLVQRGPCILLGLTSALLVLALMMLFTPASSATTPETNGCDVPGIMDCALYDQSTLWTSPVTIPVDKLATRDMDRDGCEDVVMCTEDGNLTVLSPSRHVELWNVSVTGTEFYYFALGHVDGHDPVEVVISTSSGLYCFEYGRSSPKWVVTELDSVHGLTMSDFNSNGTDSIFLFNYTTLMRLDDRGRVVFERPIDPIDNELGRLSMLVVDADMDGAPEVVVTDSGYDLMGRPPVWRNGHHIWVFDCDSGQCLLVKTFMGDYFCSAPTIMDIDGDRYLAFGLSYCSDYDVFLYSVKTGSELVYDVYDNDVTVEWSYVATIPGQGSEDDRIMMYSKASVIMVWSNGSTRPDWSWETELHYVMRDQPLVCDIDSDGRYEVLVPFANVTIFDADTGRIEGVFNIAYGSTKLEVHLSLLDSDGDGLSEICYGYYERREPLYTVFLLDSPNCSASLDPIVLTTPVTLYPTHPRRLGFVVENITADRLHYSLRLTSSSDRLGDFHTVEVSFKDGAVLLENGSLLSASAGASGLYGTSLFIQVSLTASWDFGHEDLNDLTLVVCTRVGNLTTRSLEGVYRVERDLVMLGEVSVSSRERGTLVNGSWVRAGEDIGFSGFQVVFEGTTDVLPPRGSFLMAVSDDRGTTTFHQPGDGGHSFSYEVPEVLSPLAISVAIHMVALNSTTPVQYSITLRVDGGPPTVLGSHPEDAAWAPRRMVRFSANVSDGGSGLDVASSSCSLCLNGSGEGPWSSLEGASVRYVEDVVVLELEGLFDDGVNRVSWNLSDRVGNHRIFVQTVRVDLTPISFGDLSPAGWVHDLVASCTIVVTDTNGSGVDGSSLQVSTRTFGPNFSPWADLGYGTRGERLEAVYEYHGVEGKANYIRFRGRDNAAGAYSVSATYELWMDSAAPELSAKVPEFTLSRTVEFSWSASDPNGLDMLEMEILDGVGAPLVSAIVQLEGAVGGRTDLFEIDDTWRVGDAESYRFTLLLEVRDVSERVTALSFNVTYVPEVPRGALGLGEGEWTNSTGVRVTLTHAGGLSPTHFRLAKSEDGLEGVDWVEWTLSTTLDLELPGGEKTVWGQLRGAFNVTSEPFSDTITLDVSAPVVEVVVPSRTGEDTVRLSITVSDDLYPDPDVEWRINGGEWSSYTGEVMVSLEEGDNLIEVRAQDAAGNVGTSERTIRSDNSLSVGGVSWLILVVILVVVTLIGVWNLRDRYLEDS